VKQIAVWREGNHRMLATADAMWEDFFAAAGIVPPDREAF
jgi:hypothetical protein